MTGARKISLGLTLLTVVAVGGVATLFTIQNSSRMTDLSLDLYVFATHLQTPLSVPVLMWAAFGSGLLLGLVGMVVSRVRQSGRMGDLEMRAARAELGRTNDDDWT